MQQDVPDVNVNERSVKIVDSDGDIGEWVEDVRRIFAVTLKDGVDRLRVQMIRLNSLPNHRMLEVEAINVDYDDWIFGCAANQISTNQRFWFVRDHIAYLYFRLAFKTISISVCLAHFQFAWALVDSLFAKITIAASRTANVVT